MDPEALTALERALPPGGRVAIDTAPLIYFVEEHPRYFEAVETVLRWVDSGRLEAVTSTVTLIEVLSRPIEVGDLDLSRRYVEVLTSSQGFTVRPVDVTMAVRAAELRAKYGLRTPDAIQVACAIESGCDALVTNDIKLRGVAETTIVVLDDLVDPPRHPAGGVSEP